MQRLEQQSPPSRRRDEGDAPSGVRRAGALARRALAPLMRLDREAIKLIAALAPALGLVWPLLHETPLSYDHATHLFTAWHFWEEMLGRGRLRGWSHFWAFGTPTNELVPLGSDLWVVMFRAITFAQLSWLKTYALAFAGLMIFKTFAAYRFTKLYLGYGAALICAWVTVLDPGGMLEGGWEWHTHWGVWPVTLSMSFVLLSLTKLEHVLREGRSRDVLWAGSWFAAALLTHPMAVLAMAVAVPLWALDLAFRPGRIELVHVGRALAGLAFGAALSSFYMLPLLARSGETQDLGWLGDSLPVMSQKLVEFRTFQNVWAPVHALALIGAWFALRRRVRGSVFLVTSGAALVLLSSGTLIRDLHLERVLPGLIKIEANRFLLVAKLFWFALAGYGGVALAQPLLPATRVMPRWRRVAGLALGAALGVGLLAPGWRNFFHTQIEKRIVGEDERRFFRDLERLTSYTRELRQSSTEHYRVAYHMWRNEHLANLAPVFDGSLMYKVGYTPVQIFDKVPMTDDLALLEALSVKYVVSSDPLHLPALQQEKRFGALRLYRFLNYRPDPFSVLGPGRGELLEFSPEQLRIRLSGTSPESRLKIHVASFPRWEATLDGEVLPIATVPVFGAEYPILMEVPARDGELVLRYVYRAVDWLGLCLTLAAVPAFAAGVWLGRRRAPLSAVAAWVSGRARPIAVGTLLLALATTGVAAAGTRTRDKLLPSDSIFRLVSSAGAMTLGDVPCVETSSLSFRCGASRVHADVVSGAWGLHLCMTAPDAGDLRVRVQTQLGSFLAGHYDPLKDGPGSITVSVDGEPLGTVAVRPAYQRHQHIQFDTRARRGQPASVEVVLTGMARNCFDLSVRD
jgi:hypothetical protein